MQTISGRTTSTRLSSTGLLKLGAAQHQPLLRCGRPSPPPPSSRRRKLLVCVLAVRISLEAGRHTHHHSTLNLTHTGTMRAAAAPAATPSTPHTTKRVIALDFDGVVCDSVGESSLSAFRAAQAQWPEVFNTPEAAAAQPRLVEQMRAVRPVVETGYENVVQIRLLLEGTSVEEMLASWHELLPAAMVKWRLEREPLVRLFGRVRDEWIAADAAGWLAPNRIYDGVAPAVAASLASAPRDEVYVVTTKQAQFTELLLRDMARLELPAERIYSTTLSGAPKSGVLAQLRDAHPDAADYVFVEDKLSTLEKVAATPGAEAWRLFLVDWGYNTPGERVRAAAHERISVLDVAGFDALMRHG